MPSLASQTILVTGANGYLALHVIDRLLKNGYSVRGTVRSQKAADKVRATFPEQYGSTLTTAFANDLTKPDSYKSAFDDGVTGVIHVASPVHGAVEDNVRDMLTPAIEGATAIMDAAQQYAGPSFSRVVQISSFAACFDPSLDPRPGYIYKEEDWNPVTFEEAASMKDHILLYIASKALAEKAVWKWVEDHKPRFGVVCLNPVTVYGPHLDVVASLETLSSTSKLLWQIMDATEIPRLAFAGAVDVRDVAAMSAAALDAPGARGRRLVLSRHFDWQSAADVARQGIPEARDRIPIGKPGTGEETALRDMYQVDGTEAVSTLGVNYRPLADTVNDTLRQFLAVEQKAGNSIGE